MSGTSNRSIALITGVSRPMGLGIEVARQLVSKGFDVIVTARDLAKRNPSFQKTAFGQAFTLDFGKPSFPICVSEDQRRLVDSTGKPFLYWGDAGWHLFH